MMAHTHVRDGSEVETHRPALMAHLWHDHDVPLTVAEAEPRLAALVALHRSFSGQPTSGPLMREPSPGPSTRWVLYPEHGASFALIGGRLFCVPLRATREGDQIQGTHVKVSDLRDAFEVVEPVSREHFATVERDLFIRWLREYQTEPDVSYILPDSKLLPDEPETDEAADRAEESALRALDDERGK